jgi:hypothetical protein
MKTLPRPWTVAMEATIFTGWIYDHLPRKQFVYFWIARDSRTMRTNTLQASRFANDGICVR